MRKNTLLWLSLLIVPMALLAAEGKKPAGLTLPNGAKQVEPYTYRYTDPQGAIWIYRETPFGLRRYEDKPAVAVPVKVPEGMKAVEDGDSIRFERPSPFGMFRWVRKKTELTNMEREAWNQTHRKTE